jgi:hypothetical protein
MTPDMKSVFAAERADRRDNHVVSVHETAGWTPTALHLNDGGCGGCDCVCELIGEGCEKVSSHAAWSHDY